MRGIRVTLALAVGLALVGITASGEVVKEGAGRLKPPPGNVVLFKVYAKGVQNYVSKALPAKADLYEWVPAPRATLFDFADREKKVGKHYGGAGPTWEAQDGSKVVAELPPVARAEKPGAIPWLLLRAKSHEGTGVLSKVTYIQRVDTRGGLPPALRPTRPDLKSPVEYTATYVFYGPGR